MKINKLLTITFSLMLSIGVASCGNNSGGDNSSSGETVKMTESYKKARNEFKTVTGIELPALDNLEADEYPYTEGDTDYCFDIVSGSALNFATYQTFENFFKTTLGNCDASYPDGDEANDRDAQWTTSQNRWYQTYWNAINKEIYINTTLKQQDPVSNMTESYRSGREQFHTITGVWLPELENIELLPSSEFSTTNQTACFDFLGDRTLFNTVLAYMKTTITQAPQYESENGAYWEYVVTVNNRDKKYNFDVSFDPDNPAGSAIYINGMVRDFYNVTLTAGTGGSVTLKMGSRTYENNVASVTSGDYLILTATPDNGYAFIGWYIGNNLLSADNPHTYQAEKQDVTIQGKFEESPNMTPSYATARTSFQTFSGITLPELADVQGVFEKLGESQCMVDISGATSDAYISVKNAFATQVGFASTVDSFGKDVWEYSKSKEGIAYACNLNCFFVESDNMIVIMYQEDVVDDSYVAGRAAFKAATGVELPLIAGLKGDIMIDSSSVMFDIVLGDNLSHDTYNSILSYLDTLTGWTSEDTTNDPVYETHTYNNSSTEISFQVVYDSENNAIYINAFNTLTSFDAYQEAKEYLATRYGITLPSMTNVSAMFSCAADSTWMTFDLFKESNFSEDDYNQFVSALTTKLGNGTDASDENQKRTTWMIDGLFWDVTWDLTTGIAINFNA